MQIMKTVEIEYAPFEKQRIFHESNHKFRAFIGGIGSGKTFAGAQEAVRICLNYSNSVGMILAPTYRMLLDVTERAFFEVLPEEMIENWSKGNHHLILKNGSEVYFRSADDPEKLRGPNLDWFWGDEAALYRAMVWKIMIGRIRKGVVDKGFVTTTPKGFDWVYEVFEKNKTENHFYVRSSSRENPHLPGDFIQSLQAEYKGVFAEQEIEGLFRVFEGLVYKGFLPDTHLIDREQVPKIKDVVVGVDWGYSNPSVLLAIGYDDDGRVYVLEEF